MELLKELCLCPAVSGCEGEIITLIKNNIPEGFSVKNDIHGSLIAENTGKGKGVVFVSAVDTPGFYITYIDSKGYLYFSPAGDIEAKNLIGQRVLLKSGKTGVICHDEKKDEFFIDAGFKDSSDAENNAEISDYAALLPSYCRMEDFASGYRMGKNAAILAMLQAMQKTTDKKAYFVFLTKSAVDQTSFAFLNDIDASIIVTVEGVSADDLPKNDCPTIKPGKAVVKIKDKAMLCSREITALLENGGQDTQRGVSEDTGIGKLQREFGGRKCGGAGIPVRYKGTLSESVLTGDIHRVTELLGKLL